MVLGDIAQKMFDKMPERHVISWSCMMDGYVRCGECKAALALLRDMQKLDSVDVRPNEFMMPVVLSTCGRLGAPEQWKWAHTFIDKCGMKINVVLGSCLIDLYAKCGSIERASGAYVLLSSVYATTGKWKELRHVRDAMEAKGIRKVPACSMVEVGCVIHEFFWGDESHPETREIHLMPDEIRKLLKMEGYVGNTNEVLLDLDDEEGEELALSLHSEKLAVAYAILKTSAATPIHILKNLRICADCHVAIKMISRVFARYIEVRDCNRFHHFANGVCSCKDYW
ncbi:pentatricopeptide repeat (PPR) superfamily protein [Actinidia rufa]|uniref:Pentatricopeptide repeat (PPR) superfamily protein n=1 Tax=Actinidia rufa TaxID=165716 RepID=A0A7J0DRM1_9ERIC|nr:pentatricopeptide repeat (PPR) superfamily protein [Actinidia rufa]